MKMTRIGKMVLASYFYDVVCFGQKVNVVEFPSIDSFDVATNISCRNVGLQRGQRKVCT